MCSGEGPYGGRAVSGGTWRGGRGQTTVEARDGKLFIYIHIYMVYIHIFDTVR